MRPDGQVVAALRAAGVPAVPVQPSSGAVAGGGGLVGFATETLRTLMVHGAVPVVFGDAVAELDEQRPQAWQDALAALATLQFLANDTDNSTSPPGTSLYLDPGETVLARLVNAGRDLHPDEAGGHRAQRPEQHSGHPRYQCAPGHSRFR